ncbi:MAG: hypothetical protein RIQ28_453, partial [Pseudomonadota bacterium]
ILGPLAHCFAAFNDDRVEAHLREDQGGEQTARPCADNHRPFAVPALRGHDREFVGSVWGGLHILVVGKACQYFGLVRHHAIDDIGQQDRVLFAGIIAPAENLEAGEVRASIFRRAQIATGRSSAA